MLYIPPSIKVIGAHAFEGVIYLPKVVIPGSVETIVDYAFSLFKEKVSFHIEKGTKYIGA